MTAPAGWYPQPDGTEGYWDGHAWTGQYRTSGPQDRASAVVEPQPTPVHPYAAYPPPSSAPSPYPPGPYAPGPGPYAPGPGLYAGATSYGVAPKSPALAVLASFFVPGLGSMINGEVGKGVGILLLYLIGLPLCLLLIGIPIVFGTWIWGMIDAYTGANNWNYRHGIIS